MARTVYDTPKFDHQSSIFINDAIAVVSKAVRHPQKQSNSGGTRGSSAALITLVHSL